MLLNGNNNELNFVVARDTNCGRTLEHMHKAYGITKNDNMQNHLSNTQQQII